MGEWSDNDEEPHSGSRLSGMYGRRSIPSHEVISCLLIHMTIGTKLAAIIRGCSMATALCVVFPAASNGDVSLFAALCGVAAACGVFFMRSSGSTSAGTVA